MQNLKLDYKTTIWPGYGWNPHDTYIHAISVHSPPYIFIFFFLKVIRLNKLWIFTDDVNANGNWLERDRRKWTVHYTSP